MPDTAARARAAASSNLPSRSARSSRLWLLTWLGLYFGYWISLLLVVPAAGFLVRLFMIQHDCGHGSFFRSKWLNDWIGRVLGVLTFTPYDFWRHTHAVHHASSGNLGRRGMGDIDTLTVARISRAAAAGAAALSPVPPSAGDVRRRPDLHVPAAAPAAGRFDARRLAAVALDHADQSGDRRDRRGADLFHRHQGLPAGASADHRCSRRRPASGCSTCSTSSRTRCGTEDSAWNWHEAALHGSSHYDLPGVLRWFTANIGVHHVHHLSAASRSIGCATCCAITPSSARSAG